MPYTFNVSTMADRIRENVYFFRKINAVNITTLKLNEGMRFSLNTEYVW